uniref:Casein kinase II subunit beta n=1 Tax=Chromera velia CCMP2878 TaxID=1169474 RepID=A0A0G4HXQ7_9ALVE|mmetsp:Transcript_44232/g.87259  ORF Transcript_44232/g.87259 Transcript_44232/m.87259 type:complete len:301 (-) Transcript_44232:188-1090(-)|eukprot:Cvel_9321.t1-p1 / transcript=Cvel_9321.t1 / gene=Cvel_9321 / organism=Chromera_velia_CCMP2878 / gene_product=Putative casein kinase II subunit beta-4, putative / transcript_product=Putative casein kinase II subunit beta-4, putative / location=Cvel_scaffold534:65586-68726(+) / protein_length=300 / sequence_SO=supercontig / SO=protein_coding / is_pseudo=false
MYHYADKAGLVDSDEDEDASIGPGWIQWFCSLEGHEFFCEVDEEFLRDNFNLHGLRGRIRLYDQALDMVLKSEPPDDDEQTDPTFMEIYRDAADLYGLAHARFIITPRGLQAMREKFLRGQFGHCPRALCDRQTCLPVGLAEDLRTARVKLYCPKCQEVYLPKGSKGDVDGAFFGPSFPHLFLQAFSSLVPLDIPTPFVPRVFGFRINGKKSIVEGKLELGEYGRSTVSQYKPEGPSSEIRAAPPWSEKICAVQLNTMQQQQQQQQAEHILTSDPEEAAGVGDRPGGAGEGGSAAPPPVI